LRDHHKPEVDVMPQAVWTGSLSFGLVNIPIKLYSATSPKDVRFHQYEGGTGRRIRYRRVAEAPAPEPPPETPPATSSRSRLEPPMRGRESTPERPSSDEPPRPEVPWEQIVKGFEIEPGRVVTVTSDEFLSLAPERTRVIEVEEFVDLHEIDPVYYEKSYCVVPGRGAGAGAGAERPYWLLARAMESSGKVAIGRFVMRTREYLAAIRPAHDVLTLETLFFADEVRDPMEIWSPAVEEPSEREVRMARRLIEALAAPWDPSRHRDTQRERVLELLRGKVGQAFVVPEEAGEEVRGPSATDLMAALKASVEAAREARSGGSKGRRRTG